MAAYRVHDRVPGDILACARLAAQGHPPPGKLAPHLSSLRLYYRSVSVSRRKALESRLDEERLMNLTMRTPVVRLLEQRSGGALEAFDRATSAAQTVEAAVAALCPHRQRHQATGVAVLAAAATEASERVSPSTLYTIL